MKKEYRYRWTGLNTQGCVETGMIYVSNKKALVTHLEKNNIILLEAKRTTLKCQVKADWVNQFTAKLNRLISHGVGIKKAINMMQQSNQINYEKHLLTKILDSLNQGASLSNSLRQLEIFSPFYLAIIQSAEESNHLKEALKHLEAHLKNTKAAKQQIKKALRYPSLVFSVSLICIIGLLYYIVPQFESTFAQNGKQLPFITQQLLLISRIIQHHILSLILTPIMTISISKVVIQNTDVLKQKCNILLFRTPVIAPIYKLLISLQLSQTLFYSLSSGLTLLHALEMFGDQQSSSNVKKNIQKICRAIKQGETLSSLLNTVGFFPTYAVDLIRMAEKTNTLADVCSSISQELQQELNNKIRQIIDMIEPIVMIILSIVVGTVIVAMYLPLFQLGDIMM